jgi:hypothetical protein
VNRQPKKKGLVFSLLWWEGVEVCLDIEDFFMFPICSHQVLNVLAKDILNSTHLGSVPTVFPSSSQGVPIRAPNVFPKTFPPYLLMFYPILFQMSLEVIVFYTKMLSKSKSVLGCFYSHNWGICLNLQSTASSLLFASKCIWNVLVIRWTFI